MRKKRKKGSIVCILEYAVVSPLIFMSRFIPLRVVRVLSSVLGSLLYVLVPKRRDIALENLRHAFRGEKEEQEIRDIALASCRSFFVTFLETAKISFLLTRPDAIEGLRPKTGNLDELFEKARQIHDESGGCIFVTPHIGNWELLPYVSSVAGIPLTVVVRPLDNRYLERLLYAKRAASGQVIIPKRNALFSLQRTLQKGGSVGMLPDQSTMKGIPVNFFTRKATTTPIPAILATTYNRPIVVVACCRRPGGDQYEGFVSDPIFPREYVSEKQEIFRLTEAMNRDMESIIRKYPEQYLWMHNRWKTYRNKEAVIR